MLKVIRNALSGVGGVQIVAATLAIGWGLTTLQKLAEEKSVYLVSLSDAIVTAEARIADAARIPEPIE